MKPVRARDLLRRDGVWLALVGTGYLATLLAVFRVVWWGGPAGRLFFGWDCLREYWPDVVFAARAIADGEWPMWNPYSLGGYPFHGDPQAGLLSPLHWLLYAAAWVSKSQGAWLIQVKQLATLWIGLVGTHVLVRQWTRSHAAGAVAALVYVLGSPILVHKNGALMWPMMYLPWGVLALDRFLGRPSVGRGAVLAFAVWLAGTAGHPQAFFYDLVVLAAYGAFRVGVEPRRLWAVLRVRPWGVLAFVGLTALLLAPVYRPAAEAVAASPRAHRGLEYVLQSPLPPAALRELLLPNIDTNWMWDVYVGPLALIAAAYGVLAAPRRARAERIFWFALGAFALVLALGRHGGVLPWLAEHAPGFGLFRIAYRHKVIFGFAIAVAAGHGVGALFRGEGTVGARVALAALAAAWVAVATLARMGIGFDLEKAAAKAATWALVLGGGGLALLVAAAFDHRRARGHLWGAAALVLADLWVAGQSKIDILQPPPRPERDAALLAGLEGLGDTWRLWNDGLLLHATPYLLQVRELSGFLNPIEIERTEEIRARARRQPGIVRHFNVRYWIAPRAPALPGVRAVRPNVWELDGATPLVRVYPRAETAPAPAILDRLASEAAIAAALVEAEDAPSVLPSAAGVPVDGRVIRYARNRIDVEVDAPEGGVLVLNEMFFPGWRATVNGVEAPVFRANYALRAVIVPAGRSAVSFRFAPRGYAGSLAGFFLALGAGAVLIGREWVRESRAQEKREGGDRRGDEQGREDD